MKRLLLLLTLILVVVSAMAVPARRVAFKHTQSDGTVLTLMLEGDEHFHYYRNVETGESMLRNENGDFYVATSSVIAARKTAGIARNAKISTVRSARLKANTQATAGTNGARRAIGTTGNMTGNKKGLVILVNYTDKSLNSSHTQTTFNNMFNQTGYSTDGHIGSVSEYFSDQSYGTFNLSFDVVGPVTVSKAMSYYGGNDSSGNDEHPAEMVIEACRAVDSSVNFADYDWDNDGYVDQVFVIYAGYGENYSGADENTIWPHEYDLASAKYFGDGTGTLTLDNVKINTYACCAELYGTSGTTLNGMGTACHEFSHCLGYPDSYDTDYSGGVGMDSFDVMCGGSYNGPSGRGQIPCGYTAYERAMAGWLTPVELTDPYTVTNMAALNDEPVAYIINNDGNTNEYLLLENRQSNRWFSYYDSSSAGHGLFVTHIDYNATVWSNNAPNDDPDHQRMTWIPADGKYGTYSSSDQYWTISNAESKGDFFPGTKSVTSLTGTSHTSVGGIFFTNTSAGTKNINHSLTEITETSGKIGFLFDGGATVDDGSRYTITYNAGTGNCGTASWTQTDFQESTTLPTAVGPTSDWTFAGWHTAAVSETSSYPVGLLYANSTYLPTENVTLYAVYKKTVSGGGVVGDVYEYTTGFNAGSDYIFVTANEAGSAYMLDCSNLTTGSSTTVTATSVTVETDGSKAVVINPNTDCVWTSTSTSTVDNLVLSNGDYYLKINGAGIAKSLSSTTVYWSSTGGLYGKNSKKTTNYYLQPSGSSLTSSSTTASSTNRLYMFKKSSSGGTGSSTIYNSNPPTTELPKPTISFAASEQTIYLGDTNDTFTATVTGSTGEVSYTSSADWVATVGPSTGRVVAHAVGQTTITATVAAVSGVTQSASASYTLTVAMPALASIAATTMPDKTSYFAGDYFEKTGMVITATYENGYTEVLEAGEYTMTPNDVLTLDVTGITISYTENGITKTTVVPITVAEAPKYTVTFVAGTGTCATTSLTETDYQSGVTLPTATSVSDEWAFAGWATAAVTTETTTAPTLLTPGSTYAPTADVTLYAVYSHSETSGGSGDYELVEEALSDWAGDYLIAYSSTVFADGRIGGTTETGAIGKSQTHVNPGTNLSGTTVAAAWGDTYHVTLEVCTGGYVLKTQDGQYNYHTTNSSNGLSATDTKATAAEYPITVNFVSSSDVQLKPGGTAAGAILHYNNTSGTEIFRFYKSGSQSPVYLYKKQGVGGTTTYFSNPVGVELTTPTVTFAEEGPISMFIGDTYTNTLTVEGSEGEVVYSTSNAAVATVAENGEVTAVGVGTATITAYVNAVAGVSKAGSATYDVVVTAPALTGISITTAPDKTTYYVSDTFDATGMEVTATYENGYSKLVTDYTLTPTADTPLTLTDNTVTVTYTEGEVTKTADVTITVTAAPTFTVTFNAGTGDCTVPSLTETAYQSGVTLPTATAVSDDWTFAGWATAAVEETTTAPTLLMAGSTYAPTENVTLYAVYKQNVGGSGSGDYKLVEEALTDWAGDYLIAYSSTVFANGQVGGTSEDNALGKAQSHVDPETNLSGTTVAGTWGDQYRVTLEAISNGYLLMTQDSLYNYQSSNANGLKSTATKATAAAYPITVNFVSSANVQLKLGGGAAGAIFHYNKATGTTGEMFRFYKDGGQQPVYLYKKQGAGGVTTYNSNPVGVELTTPTIAFETPAEKAMMVGDTYTNVAIVEGSTGNVVYSSSDEAVATVDANGVVTAVGVGNATITALVEAVSGATKSASTTYDIVVTMPALESIAVATPATTLTFSEGSAFSATGLTITATYENGYTQTFTEGFTTNPVAGDILTPSMTTVTVTYTEGEVTRTTTYDIVVNELPKYTVTFHIEDVVTPLTEEVANQGVVAPTVADVQVEVDGESRTYTFYGWSTTDIVKETTTKPAIVTLTDGRYMPTGATTLYAVYVYTTNIVKGFNLTTHSDYADDDIYISGKGSNQFTGALASTSDATKETLYFANGYLWRMNGGSAEYVYNSSGKADIIFTTTKSNVPAAATWTMEENADGTYTFATYDRVLANNVTSYTIVRCYPENNIISYGGTTYTYPSKWTLTYTGATFTLTGEGAASYTSHPTPKSEEPAEATISAVTTLIQHMVEGDTTVTTADIETLVNTILGRE